ncbi:hypothetical protein HOT49_gp068 [Erwinia phage vB_EamM_Alexandra]|uniref:Uncharacterized protein n=1 Tax=Erwinia phage vB_EamM_Alexandra TaxID=2201424 RepID=A0A2Z4QDM8_9CAUD|nr:hypothetical protein HOT49_gp068 [Erwinia phage vB_EamM_Alexandra]AWY08348.1 hypothetical protein Alexandra_68 [Erwinia phage vB_EamM_Alexandra]
MLHETYAIEYVDNVPQRVHVFRPEKDTQQSDYQALVSMGAFDKRMCQVCARDPKAMRFWLQRKHEWDQLVETDRRFLRINMKPGFINLPKQIHDDLWAFYRAIGWDYKSKRFIEK